MTATKRGRTPKSLHVKGRRLVVVDCETNGLYGDVRILSLAMVELRNGIAADSKLWLVNPGNVPMDPGAIEVNGLTADLLEDASPFDALVDQVSDWLIAPEGDTLTLIGHKVKFDAKRLSDEFRRLGLTLPPLQLLDTSHLVESAHVHPATQSLESLLISLSLTNSAPHTALGDALATAAATVELMYRIVESDKACDLAQVLEGLCTTYDGVSGGSKIYPAAPAMELTDAHLRAHRANLADGRRRSQALDVCLAENCDILPTRMEDGIVTQAHARQVTAWALACIDADESLSRVTIGHLLRGVGQALRRVEDPAYVLELYRCELAPYIDWKGPCTNEDACERCANESGTCDFDGVLRRCVDAFVQDKFDPFAKPSKKRSSEFLAGYNPNVARTRGRPKEGFYGELRRAGHLDAAGYGVARVADVRRVEGGREWAYQLLRKAWDDGCRTPRLTEMLASMTVVDAVENDSWGAVPKDPKAPVVTAVSLIDECVKSYRNQSAQIFERLTERRTRLIKVRDAAPRVARSPATTMNLRKPHSTIIGRAAVPTKKTGAARSLTVIQVTAPRAGSRRAK